MFDRTNLAQADTTITAYGRYIRNVDVLLKQDVDPNQLRAEHPQAYEAVRYALVIAHGTLERLNVPGLDAWELVAQQVGTYVLAARKLADNRYAFADPAGSDAWLLVDYGAAAIPKEATRAPSLLARGASR